MFTIAVLHLLLYPSRDSRASRAAGLSLGYPHEQAATRGADATAAYWGPQLFTGHSGRHPYTGRLQVWGGAL